MDQIEIRGLRVFAHHGVLPHEKRDGQTFVIDLTVSVDLSGPAKSDDLTQTIHYGELAEQVAAEAASTRFDLIERLAGHLLDLVMADHRVEESQIRIAKPDAPIDAEVDEVAVVLRRTR